MHEQLIMFFLTSIKVLQEQESNSLHTFGIGGSIVNWHQLTTLSITPSAFSRKLKIRFCHFCLFPYRHLIHTSLEVEVESIL